MLVPCFIDMHLLCCWAMDVTRPSGCLWGAGQLKGPCVCISEAHVHWVVVLSLMSDVSNHSMLHDVYERFGQPQGNSVRL